LLVIQLQFELFSEGHIYFKHRAWGFRYTIPDSLNESNSPNSPRNILKTDPECTE